MIEILKEPRPLFKNCLSILCKYQAEIIILSRVKPEHRFLRLKQQKEGMWNF